MHIFYYIPRNELNLLVGIWAQTLMDGQAFGIIADTIRMNNVGISELDYTIELHPTRTRLPSSLYKIATKEHEVFCKQQWQCM